MKVALCCIAKNENLYIRNFIEFYKNIGIDNIILYDNNQKDDEDFHDVIDDYINNGYVKLINWKNHEAKLAVLEAYNNCLTSYHTQYDWICFFDPDEFIQLNYWNNIKDYLSNNVFNTYNCIVINWVNYNDNNLIYYDSRHIQERFTAPITPIKEFDDNRHIKTIFNCNMYSDKIIFESPHCPQYTDDWEDINPVLICNTNGVHVCTKRSQTKTITPYIENAYLKHYRCKTIQEYCENKIPKLTKFGYINVDFDDNFFFKYNDWTIEKQKIYDDYITNNNPYWIDCSYKANHHTLYTVICCLFGEGYNIKFNTIVNSFIAKDNNVKYIFITDFPNLYNNVNWEIHDKNEYKSLIELNSIQATKYVKMHPFEFCNTEYCLYIDGSVLIKNTANKLMLDFIHSGKSIGLMMHPKRTNVYEEIKSWKKRLKNNFDNNNNIYNLYNNCSHILFFCAVICYKQDNITNDIIYKWYDLLTNIYENETCRSDQVLLPYIINTSSYYDNIFYIAPQLVNSNYFQRYMYKNNQLLPSNTTNRTLIKYNNKIIKCYNINI